MAHATKSGNLSSIPGIAHSTRDHTPQGPSPTHIHTQGTHTQKKQKVEKNLSMFTEVTRNHLQKQLLNLTNLIRLSEQPNEGSIIIIIPFYWWNSQSEILSRFSWQPQRLHPAAACPACIYSLSAISSGQSSQHHRGTSCFERNTRQSMHITRLAPGPTVNHWTDFLHSVIATS